MLAQALAKVDNAADDEAKKEEAQRRLALPLQHSLQAPLFTHTCAAQRFSLSFESSCLISVSHTYVALACRAARRS